MGGSRKTDVLVVGAGPVGLTSALYLAQKNVRVDLIDEQWRAAARSYALALHPSSLEHLDELGVAEELIRAGSRIDTIAWYEGGERLGTVSTTKLACKFPFVLVLPQSSLEQTLVSALQRNDVAIQWNHRLAWLHTDRDEPVAEIETLEKESSGYGVARTQWVVQAARKTQPSFVIGADGHRSVVRRELDIPFDQLGPATTYAVFEFTTDFETAGEVRVIFDSHGTSVLWPLEAGRYRFSFALPGREMIRRQDKSRLYVHVDDQSYPHLGIEQLRTLLRERAPWFDAAVGEVAWSVAVRFDNRMAKSFGSGRTWLAGDAAHLAGPIGVHSMNRGIEEAHALSSAIFGVLRDHEPVGTLQEKAKTLRKPWELLSGAELEATERAPSWAAQRARELPACLPASGRHLNDLLDQLGLTGLESAG